MILLPSPPKKRTQPLFLCELLKRLGFEERIKGAHHIFTRSHVEEILNLQPKNGKGKPYQVKQVRGVILKYNLTLED